MVAAGWRRTSSRMMALAIRVTCQLFPGLCRFGVELS
ncbi:hypothetical protein SEVIR_3G405332v4 [Setaria viridis]|uniref:Uncharacterized protein n=1 Tax=Setaria viridis TaxID=4556 RepID=A0A4U6VL84_SETVI|nr:hypothetical protein SEVIR_3G405332v2 [Setaria viridis]